ncbi:hypothetical protein [Dokdonella soli]
MNHYRLLALVVTLVLALTDVHATTPQTTAFTYQGQLTNASALANGTYNITFTLFDAASGGTQIGQVPSQPILVVNGLFTADLDFGLIFGLTQYWLEVNVNGQTLAPRQRVNTTPTAQYAMIAPPLVLPFSASQADAGPLFSLTNTGAGAVSVFTSTNPNNTANTVQVVSIGPGVIADHSQGNAGSFFVNNTQSVGAGVRGEVNSIFGNNGTAGVYGVASGTGGYAGYFEHSETTGFGITLQVITYDMGDALVVDQHGSSGDPAIFEAGGANVARIDRTGKGFFNGGTQTGGADLAELIPVAGTALQPGDVVEIDPDHPDHFRLCSSANSTRVVGVISTEPGVTLNDKHSAQTPDNGPALALAGRVPVKVTKENGAIRLGDLLVASSTPGRAMRAADLPAPGTVIGKALQNFDRESGVVSMLVILR